MRSIGRSILLAAALGSALMLGACGTASNIPTPGGAAPTTPGAEETIAKAQQTAAKICAFVPTVSTVTGIIASFINGGAAINDMATAVAKSVCNAVAPSASLRGAAASGGAPVVNGVPVQGYFLAK